MQRYLINLAYIGTNFRGIQRTLPAIDNTTIQGAIERGLEGVKPINNPVVFVSSRTDTGVHALHSTVHVDIEKRVGHQCKPEHITGALNKYFKNENLEIRILTTEHVPNTFHCRRNVVQRTYLYRLAVAKENYLPNSDQSSRRSQIFQKFMPIEEQFRCLYLLQNEFDIEKAREASKLLIGRHDFRSFMSVSGENKTKHPSFAVRTIHDIKIEPGRPITTFVNYDNSLNHYNYWDFSISGKSFVYRQIRRIISVLINVANGKLTNRDVYDMLTIPSKYSWRANTPLIPPYGLYLVNISYEENAKKFETIQ